MRILALSLMATMVSSPLAPFVSTVHAEDAKAVVDKTLRPFKPEAKIDVLPDATKKLVNQLAKATEESAKVFEPMSVEQLGFRPADGSHTPRWNAEHLRGAALMFVSKYYHSLDERIEVIERMPKQMPDDYQPAHPGWDGQKEAEALREAKGFVRRYAYLLKDVDMDAEVDAGILPPFFKTPRALFSGLAGHYKEHTDNVKKKFDAEGWPAD